MMNDWKHEWSERFATISGNSSVLINDKHFYLKWVDNLNVSLDERDIRTSYLTEVADKINAKIKIGSVFTSDIFVNGYHILLIDEDLSKVDILERNAIFKKVIWIVSSDVFDNYLHYRTSSNSLENFYSYTNVYDYINDKNKLINQLVNEPYLTEYRKSELQSLKKAVEHMTSNGEQYNTFLSEDWEKCVHYRREGIMKRLNYTFAPVFIDMGDYMYYRKYRYSPFEERKVTYLKKITHQDFIEWLSKYKTI